MIQLTADLNANYQRFIEHIQESGQVWGLQSPEGWLVVDSAEFEDSEVMPFWSDEAYARAHCVGEWESFKPVGMDLEEFVEDWLAGMDEDGVLVGPNWNADLEGLEVEPSEIAKRLSGAQ
ncbi:MAG TPA: DUF2750 domain-containing protein [Methylococcaceae bacterium]|jgi:hypothetical protein|nr:DUF2750 domain-containing protein [Methylococcaceae bacterium]